MGDQRTVRRTRRDLGERVRPLAELKRIRQIAGLAWPWDAGGSSTGRQWGLNQSRSRRQLATAWSEVATKRWRFQPMTRQPGNLYSP
jgi:hypothetical protein